MAKDKRGMENGDNGQEKHRLTGEPIDAMLQMDREAKLFRKPFPEPEVLKGYEDIVPGAADRILEMAENQVSHRQILEKRRGRASFVLSLLGQICGLLVALSAILGGVYCIAHGRNYSGSALGLSAIIGLVSVFVLGRRKKDSNC